MKPITLSINPTYLCNFRCGFCYLTEEQLGDKNKLDLKVLEERLKEVSSYTTIDYVDLYGGEMTVLSIEYIDELFNIIRKYYSGQINVITNLSRPIEKSPWLLRDDIIVSVSWDYICREKWETTLTNILLLPRDVHILMLASNCMLNWSDEELSNCQTILNSTNNIKTVEIKPYSSNQSNHQDVKFTQFEDFVQSWITNNIGSNYNFINEKHIIESLNRTRNAWSDDHVYITPAGKYAVLEFDDNDDEYFLEYQSFSEIISWAINEKSKVYQNEICNNCNYCGHCLSEHIRVVKSLDHSCNGFKNLLDWYDRS